MRLDNNESAEAYAGRKAGVLLDVTVAHKTTPGQGASKVVAFGLVFCERMADEPLLGD